MTKNSLQPSSRVVFFSGCACLAIYFVLATRGDLRQQILLFFALAGCATGICAFVAQKLCKIVASGARPSSEPLATQSYRRQAMLILLFGLLFRLVMLPTTPWLSDDIYRYMWDGRVTASGINPFLWPPSAPQLAGLRDMEVFPFINHPDVGTIYPPLLQSLFIAGQFLGGSVPAYKALMVLIDVAVLLLVTGGLRLTRRDPRLVVLYAWHPLPIIEIAGSGHADALLGLLLLLSVFMLGADKVRRAALTIGAGFLAKFVSLLLLPYVWLAHRRRILDSTVMFLAVALLGYFPFLSAGGALFAGLLTFSSKWRFNDSLFSLVYWPIEKLLPARWVETLMIDSAWYADAATVHSRRIDLALLLAKVLVALLFIGWMVRLMRRFLRTPPSLESWGPLVVSLVGGLLLLAPTFHPWYLLWILPLLAIWPNRALLLLSGTVFLSYWTLQGVATAGVWREITVVKWVEFTPVFALMVYDYWRERRTG